MRQRPSRSGSFPNGATRFLILIVALYLNFCIAPSVVEASLSALGQTAHPAAGKQPVAALLLTPSGPSSREHEHARQPAPCRRGPTVPGARLTSAMPPSQPGEDIICCRARECEPTFF